MKDYMIICLLFLLGTAACSEEDALIAQEDTRASLFMPAPSASDEESVMRRDFAKNEKCYLIFNDTIRKTPLGIDYNGDMRYSVETLDIAYLVGSSGYQTTYSYNFLSSIEEKRAAVAFIKKQLLSHLSQSLRPFSWFPVKNIFTSDWQGLKYYTIVNGERCIALALGDILSLSQEEQNSLGEGMLISALGNIISGKESQMKDFYDVSGGIYGNYFTTDYTEEGNQAILLAHGFICKGISLWSGTEAMGYYPDKNRDCEAYIKLVFNHTKEEVEAMYSTTPLVMKKYRMMKVLIDELGYIY